MQSFRVQNANGPGAIEFHDRDPADPTHPPMTFWITLTGPGLAATRRIIMPENEPSPASLFAEMAERWAGWLGELDWSASDNEVALRCSQDRAGHVTIRVRLARGPSDVDWVVESTIMAEAGQLDTIARRAEAFFGHHEMAGALRA